MNLSVLEEWIVSSGLPHGVESHFTPVREMLHWLQVRLLPFFPWGGYFNRLIFLVSFVYFGIYDVG